MTWSMFLPLILGGIAFGVISVVAGVIASRGNDAGAERVRDYGFLLLLAIGAWTIILLLVSIFNKPNDVGDMLIITLVIVVFFAAAAARVLRDLVAGRRPRAPDVAPQAGYHRRRVTPPAQPADRREPLPSLFGLPGHLLRQLSPRWRRVVLATLAVLVAAGVVAAIVLGPRIASRTASAAARAAPRGSARRRRAERARLVAEQRPALRASGEPAPRCSPGSKRRSRATPEPGTPPVS